MTFNSTLSTGAVPRIVAEPILEGLIGTNTPGGINPIPEGPAFDRQGHLYFTSAFLDPDGYSVFRLDTDTLVMERVVRDPDVGFASLVVHRDGRLFYADFFGGIRPGFGRIAVSEADGTGLRTYIDEFEGTPIIPDDLIFDADGNMYYNDFQGSAFRPTGRVIRVTPDGRQSLVFDGLAQPNGIALTNAQDRLWISEHLSNRLISFELNGGSYATDSRIHGYFTGGLLDSTTLDADENIYQAVYDGGRVEVLDANANPLAVVVPGPNPLQDYIRTTHVAIKPGTNEGYLLAGGPTGVGIFRFETFAPAQKLFSHS